MGVCKPCYRKRTKAYRDRVKDKEKVWSRRASLKRYGLTPEQYEEMLEAQGGVCTICGGAPGPVGPASVLVVDHDHETNLVRGLLCANCNSGLGYMQDNPAILERAAEYLRRTHEGDRPSSV